MRMSALFNQTRREVPSDVEVISHQLLIRAGYIAPFAPGIFSYLPLAQRSIHRIEQIIQSEIDALGGQEVMLPVVQPAELWQGSGGSSQAETETGRFTNHNGHEMVLATSYLAAVADLVRNIVHSYRQLPALIYHKQTMWRDDPHPRAGLIRTRQITKLDSYSLDANQQGLDLQYQRLNQAYAAIYQRCKLPVAAVQSDPGMLGGLKAHDYMYLSPIGDDNLLLCDQCGYSANRQIARFQKVRPQEEILLPLKKIATPHTTSIESLADLLHIPSAKTAKAVFLMASLLEAEKEQFVFAVVRGDMEVSETKLANAIKAKSLRPATEGEIRATGAVAGYASPVGLKDVLVIVDDLLAKCPNLVAGANEEGYHLLNVNLGRDYQASLLTDIAAARDGDACPNCGASMRTSRGIKVGNLFQLGTRQSTALGSTFLDEGGQTQPVIIGAYGLWLDRLLSCIAEEHHDERGLCWPITVAPYSVQLVLLGSKTGSTESTAQTLYDRLSATGIDVLFDDRPDSAGVKFNDADLLGMPLRLTVGERNLKQGMLEIKRRTAEQGSLVPVEEAAEKVMAEISELKKS
ncbi:MAG: proline--tRNA ligase [Anaerolineaceae bacterium]|nr:proline--tRNA ligase [Anaerolineaceae bacterium]